MANQTWTFVDSIFIRENKVEPFFFKGSLAKLVFHFSNMLMIHDI